MPPALTVLLNGNSRRLEGVDGPAAVDSVLAALDLKPDRVAVELNGAIVARRDWPTTTVSEGDRLEVVHFVGGGASAVPENGRI